MSSTNYEVVTMPDGRGRWAETNYSGKSDQRTVTAVVNGDGTEATITVVNKDLSSGSAIDYADIAKAVGISRTLRLPTGCLVDSITSSVRDHDGKISSFPVVVKMFNLENLSDPSVVGDEVASWGGTSSTVVDGSGEIVPDQFTIVVEPGAGISTKYSAVSTIKVRVPQ